MIAFLVSYIMATLEVVFDRSAVTFSKIRLHIYSSQKKTHDVFVQRIYYISPEFKSV